MFMALKEIIEREALKFDMPLSSVSSPSFLDSLFSQEDRLS
jgi:hypothetical protein